MNALEIRIVTWGHWPKHIALGLVQRKSNGVWRKAARDSAPCS